MTYISQMIEGCSDKKWNNYFLNFIMKIKAYSTNFVICYGPRNLLNAFFIFILLILLLFHCEYKILFLQGHICVWFWFRFLLPFVRQNFKLQLNIDFLPKRYISINTDATKLLFCFHNKIFIYIYISFCIENGFLVFNAASEFFNQGY